ncbi:acetyl-CoA carboxylase biotin carboxylase subunit [Lentimicrobium sp. L6]|uniref:acetyl/propionyl/methylcrotonyl-CoA carboxylase subunit alpha n=1 Tax=Lentimicrobium sp. L6 TaxID=2735916 RepID=UPI001556646F|nr:acetyl-CoA carboxylase biotin carboxylase subunit [Lentimicrobium sp. L6]NPD83500.1 acetyl-CoA carboxylase biotin carboxylase subunit [Lentimicrobium sp. L6]
MKKFNKILIANRGEIAVRIIKAAQKMGITSMAVYSQADKDSLHIRKADEAFCIGEESLSETYLNVGKIMEIALKHGADAIHPGYGFLAENPELVAACEKNDIVFIGPSSRAIQLMGNKIEARAFVDSLKIPMTKGVTGSPEELLSLAKNIELPILVKAAAGGGGKGMRIVRDWNDLESVIESTSREALAYFGDAEVYVEKFIENPRHIEIQLLGDQFGNVIHLYERECSIQRRYQKIIEESPSPTLDQATREKMGKAAVDIAKAINYTSAGTIEFLVDSDLNYYFLEMNTRIQVEHPVTEMVTGVDLVQEQIRIAQGEELSWKQEDIKQNGHAIEARVYAEEPENDFRPAPGFVSYYKEPKGVHIRVDSAIDQAVEIKSFFDPMISKLVVWEENRSKAITKMMASLEEFVILGLSTNIPFMLALMKEEDYILNYISTKYCDTHASQILKSAEAYHLNMDRNILGAAYASIKIASSNSPHNIWEKIAYWRLQMDFQWKLGEEFLSYQLMEVKPSSFRLKNGQDILPVEILSVKNNCIDLSIDNKEERVYFVKKDEAHILFNWKGQVFKLEDLEVLVQEDFYESSHEAETSDILKSPMPGKVIKVLVEEGGEVKKGQTLLIVEAMKMENNILASRDGKIEEILVQEGEMVDNTKILLRLEEAE